MTVSADRIVLCWLTGHRNCQGSDKTNSANPRVWIGGTTINKAAVTHVTGTVVRKGKLKCLDLINQKIRTNTIKGPRNFILTAVWQTIDRKETRAGRPPKTEERERHLVWCESLLRVGGYRHIHCPTKRAIHLPHVNTPTTHYLFSKIRVRVPTISVIP